jgi:predicted acylesterase/phospholipase RssA
VIPFQECKFRRNKFYLSEHFHLAFQGGGAKGLAYIGAYKSIRERKCLNSYEGDRQKRKQYIQTPIKSIMGSSTGGITAVGISAGIPEY